MTSTPLTPLLIDEATKKSGLVWVTTSAGVSPVWLLWHDGSAYVLSGPGEQPCPGLEPGGGATVTVRSKDKGSRLVTLGRRRHPPRPGRRRSGRPSCRCSWASGSTWSTARLRQRAGPASAWSTG